MTLSAGTDGDVAELRAQVAALTDFVTAVTAALIADHRLAAGIVTELMEDDSARAASDGGTRERAALGVIARNALTIAGRLPVPSPLRLISSKDDRPIEN